MDILGYKATEEDISELVEQWTASRDIIYRVFNDYNFIISNKTISAMNALCGKLGVEYKKIDTTKYDSMSIQKALKVFYEKLYKKTSIDTVKRLGIVYTPDEVAEFMVLSLQSVLKEYFNKDLSSEDVSILDPATGIGTYIVELLSKGGVIDNIHGIEITPTALLIAKINIEYNLYKQNNNSRVDFNKIHKANTLDGMIDIGTNNTMCIIGNPPYNAKSKNKGAYIEGLMKSYFKEPNSINNLQERNSKNVNDDYCKFFRVAEKYIDSNREGVLCYITNSGYLHNTTFRGMRYHLLQTFETIYIVDLVGENVFDIKTPTCIFIGIKKKEHTNTLADVYYTSINGTREEVFKALRTPYNKHTYTKIDMIHPYYFFIPKVLDTVSYPSFDSLNDIFMIKSTGVETAVDGFIIAKKKDVLRKRIQEYIRGYDSPETLESKYDISIERARMLVDKRSSLKYDDNKIMNIVYRPFDNRYIYYERSILNGDRYDIMKHIIGKDTISLLCAHQTKSKEVNAVFITQYMSECKASEKTIKSTQIPLYTYDNDIQKDNIHPDYKAKIENIIGTTTPADDILAYIYGILHTPQYRTTYLEDLKIDYPRIPLPHSKEHYDAVIELSKELIEYHLLKTKEQNSIIRSYIIVPNNTSQITVDVQKSSVYKDNKVYINKDCYVDNVSREVYDVVIGGYQVAYKWLYNRNKEELDNDDIQEYRKILIALEAHVRIMKELDMVYKNTTIV